MMGFVGTVVFMGATTLALGTMWLTVAPQWRRIVRLASGQAEQPFHPLEQLARAEQRIAVRRWASAPAPTLAMMPAPIRRLRAA